MESNELDFNALFKAANLPLPKIAELSGLHVDTLRSISSGRTTPRPETRTAIADALDAHSKTLRTLSRTIRRG